MVSTGKKRILSEAHKNFLRKTRFRNGRYNINKTTEKQRDTKAAQ